MIAGAPMAKDRRLSDAARHLAADPSNLAFVGRIVAHWTRKLPDLDSIRDDIESAAYLGLCEAARTFDPDYGRDFRAFAYRRVVGEIKESLRQQGIIRGRRHTAAPKVESLDRAYSVGELKLASLADLIPSGDGPIGWEIESSDAIEVMSRRLPNRHRLAVRLFYRECRSATMKLTAEIMGVTESRVSVLLSQGLGMMKGGSKIRKLPPPKCPYHGVAWMETNQQWQVQIGYRGVNRRVGYFATVDEAARAYDRARVSTPYFGKVAPRLNFPSEHPADWLERCREMGRRETNEKFVGLEVAAK